MWQGTENRRFPRGKYKCVVTLRQASAQTPLSSVTENIGLGGICALLDKGIEIFAPVDLIIHLEDGKPPLRTGGTVVWVVRRRELRKGSCYDTGIEFSGLSAQDRTRVEAVIDKTASS